MDKKRSMAALDKSRKLAISFRPREKIPPCVAYLVRSRDTVLFIVAVLENKGDNESKNDVKDSNANQADD